MALYFLNLKTFGRSNNSSAPGAAAYRAGERIRDERTGQIHDHTGRQGVMHKEIVLPSRFADDDMAWARDRAVLWNAAESAESRKNARVAREYLVVLPYELSDDQRAGLALGFARELSDRYRFAVDVVVHAPRDFPGSDPRNFHAHLLATTREVALEGLAAKTTLELNDANRRKLGLGPGIDELFHVRERWAAVANEALRDANVAARIDHRTLEAQGIEREPKLWIPRVPYEIERRGFRSVVADRMREEHRARVQERARHEEQTRHDERAPHERAPHEERPRREDRAQPQEPVPSPRDPDRSTAAVDPPVNRRPSLEEMRRQARENWLRMRQEIADRQETADRGAAPAEGRGHDDDFTR